MNNDLSSLRASLDGVDQLILEHLAKRRAIIRDVMQVKARDGHPLIDRGREADLIARIAKRAQDQGLDRHAVERVYKEIIADSRRLQAELMVNAEDPRAARTLRVAYSGVPGCYSELAARKHFRELTDRTTFESGTDVQGVVEAVKQERADFGVIPIENTTAGSINETYDLLTDSGLPVVGEVIYHVDHCLLGLEGATIAGLSSIKSHPMALAQCAHYLRGLGHTQILPVFDTA
ncbi:MAG: prephenate dehydratase domain-containing protein, partial [Planctomycetota bacterium]